MDETGLRPIVPQRYIGDRQHLQMGGAFNPEIEMPEYQSPIPTVPNSSMQLSPTYKTAQPMPAPGMAPIPEEEPPTGTPQPQQPPQAEAISPYMGTPLTEEDPTAVPPMQTGGKGPANAELENKEVVEGQDGSYETKKGKYHEQGGIKTTLQEGDYVWSDHLKYKGKSFANWFKDIKESPMSQAEKTYAVEDLREMQEQVSGRTGGEAGGQTNAEGLPMAQEGLPFDPVTYRPPVDPALDYVTKPKITRPPDPSAGGIVGPMSDETYHAWKYGVSDGGPYEDRSGYPEEGFEEVPESTKEALKKVRLTTERPDKAKSAPLDYAAMFDNAPYAVEENSRARQLLKQYGAPAASALMGAIGMGIAGSQKGKKIKTGSNARPVSAERIHIDRANNRASEKTNARMYLAALDNARKSGVGLGSTAAANALYVARAEADQQGQDSVHKMNINASAEEQKTNAGNRLEADRFNAELAFRNNSERVAEERRMQSIDNARKNYLGQAAQTMGQDALRYHSDMSYRDKILEGTGIVERDLQKSRKEFDREHKRDNKNSTAAMRQKDWERSQIHKRPR